MKREKGEKEVTIKEAESATFVVVNEKGGTSIV